MGDFTVKDKDGKVNKEETARLKYNAATLKRLIKTDFMGNVRDQRISEIPRDAILAGARQAMAIGGSEHAQTELQMKRIAKKIQKKYLGKPSPLAHGGSVKKYAYGGGIRKAKTYG
tara:strand:+ start:199 stop:546 length:348 start_codon:yes stop_codon:yes gene_type:complete